MYNPVFLPQFLSQQRYRNHVPGPSQSQNNAMANNTASHNDAGGISLADLEGGRGHFTYPSMPPPAYSNPPHQSAAPNNNYPHYNPHVYGQPNLLPRPPKRSRRRRCCASIDRRCASKCCKFWSCLFVFVTIVAFIYVAMFFTGSTKAQRIEAFKQDCTARGGVVEKQLDGDGDKRWVCTNPGQD